MNNFKMTNQVLWRWPTTLWRWLTSLTTLNLTSLQHLTFWWDSVRPWEQAKQAVLARLGRCLSQCEHSKPANPTAYQQFLHFLEATWGLVSNGRSSSKYSSAILQSMWWVILTGSYDIASSKGNDNKFF